MFNVFISHNENPTDAPMVDWLYKTLQSQGMTVFVARHVRQPGNDVALKVKQAIDSSNVVLAFLSKGGAASNAVGQEIGYAVKAEKTVIPFVESGVKPTLLLH